MLRLQEYLRNFTLLNDTTTMNDRNTVADALNHVHFVSDQHNGQMESFINIEQ
ncbi:hypothetical protein D3C78_1590570 [compost metagenome]